MSRLSRPRKPIERPSHHAPRSPSSISVEPHIKTTMCAMCSKHIPSSSGPMLRMANGRWYRVCDEHAPRRALLAVES